MVGKGSFLEPLPQRTYGLVLEEGDAAKRVNLIP